MVEVLEGRFFGLISRSRQKRVVQIFCYRQMAEFEQSCICVYKTGGGTKTQVDDPLEIVLFSLNLSSALVEECAAILVGYLVIE